MTIELTAPRNYSEMDEKQLRYVAALMVAGQTEEQIRTKCFIRFTGIKPIGNDGENYYFKLRKQKESFVLTAGEVAEFSMSFAFITTSFKGIVPVAKIGRYKAVDRLLRNTTFAQYIDIENYYQAYIFTKEEKYLTKLIASLYLRKSYAATNFSSAEKNMTRKATDTERMIVTLWVVGLKYELALKFKYLFRKKAESDDDDELTPPNMLEIVTNQVRMLTDGDITKNKQILAANTWDALSELDNKCREYEELKSKTKQNV